MSEPIRLRLCPACQTGIPAESTRCPECSADLPPVESAPGGAPFDARTDPFGALFGADPQARRTAVAPMIRSFLARNLGCLGTTLLIVFGVPMLIGALAGNALGGLAVVLILVGSLGIALTGWLIYMVWPARKA